MGWGCVDGGMDEVRIWIGVGCIDRDGVYGWGWGMDMGGVFEVYSPALLLVFSLFSTL